jgi:hypothetical protein
METLKFKTNINCGGCIAKVTPFLNSDTTIKKWQVDTVSPDKILSVEGSHLKAESITAKVKEAGFKVIEEIKGISPSPIPASGFWESPANWKRAGFNTLNCLIGCSIGDFGAIIYMQYNHPHMSMWLMMGIAIIAGLTTSVILETIILKVKEGFAWTQALTTAFSMSFISMLAMEISENMTDYFVTGGGNVPLTDSFYWFALGISLIAGFLVPLPYNYYKLQKYGKACH